MVRDGPFSLGGREHVLAIALITLITLVGCVTPPAPVPMRVVKDDFVDHQALLVPVPPVVPAKCLVVFLPGAGDHAEHFTRENFVSAIRARGLSVDIISTDATLGYYLNGSVIERLEEDVLAPAGRNYAHTWFIGNSMGGHGSLLYPSRKPGTVTGVFALAPWLGNSLPEEIAKAGGLQRWQPGDGQEFERLLWAWLQRVTVKGEAGPEIWLGFGTADRLAKADEVLAAVLPPKQVFRAEGGHNWATWKQLFWFFLEMSTFAQQCRP